MISKSSPAQKDTPTLPDPTTAVHTIKKASTLEGEISENIGGMWTLKHEISSPRFYELLIKTELKEDTVLDLKNFHNHIKMSLNAVTRLKVDLLPDYLSIKRNTDAATLQPVIAAIRMRQKRICEFCGRIGHKADACITPSNSH